MGTEELGRTRRRIGGNSVIESQRGKFDTKCPRSDLLSIPFLSPSDADGHLTLPLPDYWSLIPPLDQQKSDSIQFPGPPPSVVNEWHLIPVDGTEWLTSRRRKHGLLFLVSCATTK